MNEAQTRFNKIDPKLREAGWGIVPGSNILVEQSAYIAPGRITTTGHKNPKKADYILEYKGQKLAVIEAKSDEKDVSEGVGQAKLYADALKIRYTYSTNGDEIWFIDMGIKNNQGEYIIPSKEHDIDAFPSPQDLWQMTFPEENPWRDKFNLCALNRSGGRQPRYYQEIAIKSVLEAVAKQRNRILLTMATGTGKTYTAFQICWKLTQTKWNIRRSEGHLNSLKDGRVSTDEDVVTTKGVERAPRILFIADRNILANQAINDFDQFPEDAMCRITPKELKKNNYKVPTARNLYFTIFQTMMTSPNAQKAEEQGIKLPEGADDQPYYMQYERDFFDFIIIDECHRGGANDESEWRKLMEYFDSAYQLGMTATPKRKDNANTYAYFGTPVYSYSLKQGIEDGFLVPFRVELSTSNIDDYKWEKGDVVKSGEIDPEKTYTESDFYNGRIQIKERDEHRVKELLSKIDPDEKTIIFCATQKHAMIVRDMVNKHKQRPANNYCERVTADDGEVGEATLRTFQDNEKLLPTILTTSYKLSTGVDARNVRNIVLMRPVQNIVEFKQIIGRGTRLFDGKYYFTIYDFVGACDMFKDPDWDGDTYCPVCGNWPCTCKKKKHTDTNNGGGDKASEHEVCPVCGHLPCTCEGPRNNLIDIKLSVGRRVTLETTWEQKIFFGDEFIGLDEYVKKLFGRIPDLFSDADDLREKWANPETREQLLKTLDEAGFAEEKLNMLKNMLKMQKCDLLDVLEYIAYDSTPMERAKRVELVKKQYVDALNKEQREFDNLILEYYASNGFKELGADKLKTFINIRFNSMRDAKERLNMSVTEIRNHYYELQRRLYCEI
ncbi:EcoAI/FtnUII family type I restriction enzme subunit R [Xylanibacter brevis]|uniref:EcoAI/FtnUII family type I restriction enzme subunit R n=1 Tax=Xylanibacter brevis TaxID=83231 RepID=UPI000480B671|nr:type I restriction endonuclease subunit R [Xylanibacter brevis]